VPRHADLSACVESCAGEDAAQVYRRLTDLHLKLDSRTDSAAAWVEASRAYTKAGNGTGASHAFTILQRPSEEQVCQRAALLGVGVLGVIVIWIEIQRAIVLHAPAVPM
jgi:hypothetical protein